MKSSKTKSINPKNCEKMSKNIQDLLVFLGENPHREGLRETPRRMMASLRYLTQGYRQDIEKVINGAVFNESYDEMVIVKDIEIFSLCEHHILPFYGKAHVAYIPKGKIIGLSKIPRVVEVYARRLQVQERLTNQVADALMKYLKPRGVGVVIEAFHLCMAMRGVEKRNAYTLTSTMLGSFRNSDRCRGEFLSLIGKR